jgi:hypothetical protein
MRICSFVNPRISVTRRAINAGNTHRLHEPIAYLNLHIDTSPRRQVYTPWAPSKEARDRTNFSLHEPLKRMLATECARLVTDYFAVQRLHDGSRSEAIESQAVIAQAAVEQFRADYNHQPEWR